MASLLTATSYLPIPAGTKYYLLKDDDTAHLIAAALSWSIIDIVVYRKRVYRNTLPASEIGRAWGTAVVTPAVAGAAVVPESIDDRAQIPAVEPRNEGSKDSLMVIWDGATGSGNVVACFPYSLFRRFSPDIPTRY